MLIRIQIAAGFALAVLLMTSMTAFAKGGFDFITITGPNLKQAVRVTDTSLTTDFFTFANFYENRTKAPADPGEAPREIPPVESTIGFLNDAMRTPCGFTRPTTCLTTPPLPEVSIPCRTSSTAREFSA